MTLRLLGITGAGDLPVAGGHVNGPRIAVVGTAVPEDRSLHYSLAILALSTNI